jgi:hypothetical protein
MRLPEIFLVLNLGSLNIYSKKISPVTAIYHTAY